MDTQDTTVEARRGPLVNRRTVAIGAVWSVPVIIAATAAPAAAASVVPALSPTRTLTKTKGSSYKLELQFPATLSGVITIVSVVATEGNPPSTFDLAPPSQTQTVGATSSTAVFTLSRNGNNKSITALVTYQVNGGPSQQVVVPILGT
jgi:hypothetical protein